MTNNDYSKLIDQLLERKIAFAAWFFPRENTGSILIGNPEDITFFNRFNQLNGEKGFVFAPFRITENSPVILLKPGMLIENYQNSVFPETDHFRSFDDKKEQEDIYSFQEKQDYLETIEKAVSEIKKRSTFKSDYLTSHSGRPAWNFTGRNFSETEHPNTQCFQLPGKSSCIRYLDGCHT